MKTIIRALQQRALLFVGRHDSLRGKLARSATWVGLGFGTEMVLRLGSSLILTRLLSPAAFGIMATTQVFIYTAVMLSDVGIRSLVITHERADDPQFLRTVWTFQIIRGVILAAVVALLGQLLGVVQGLGWLSRDNSFDEPTLPAMVAVLGVTLAFEGMKSTNEHIMARDLRQDILVKLETATKILSTLITVSAVWVFRSVWGFVYAALLVSLLRSLLSNFLVPGSKMRLHWDRNDIAYVINHGKWVGISSWTTLASNLADKILIGSFFGSHNLGLYTLALTLADALHSLITKLVNAVSLPAIYQLIARGDDNFKAPYYRMRLYLQAVSSCVGLGLILIGPILVTTFYDQRYIAAGGILSLVSIKFTIFFYYINKFILEARKEFSVIAYINLFGVVFLWGGAFIAANFLSFKYVILFIALSKLPERILIVHWILRDRTFNLLYEIQSSLAALIIILLSLSVIYMSGF